MATHSSVLAWRIPGTGEPGGLLSVGSHRVGHDWSDFTAAAWVKQRLGGDSAARMVSLVATGVKVKGTGLLGRGSGRPVGGDAAAAGGGAGGRWFWAASKGSTLAKAKDI